MFDLLAGGKTTYVPFKGTGAAVTALLGKQVAAEWGYTSVGASHRDQVRMLAVATDERHPQFPDVPTFKELGIDMSSGAYRGVAVPESTPEELRKQIRSEEHTSELQSLMRISYAVFCLTKKKITTLNHTTTY